MVTAARARSWYNPAALIQSLMMRPRVYGAAIATTAGLVLLPSDWPHTIRTVVAWDLGGVVYLFFAFWLITTCGADKIRHRAAHRDDSRIVILTLILFAICASFGAIAGLIGHAKLATVGTTEKALVAALAIVTIMLSWGVTQVAFALHYAHDYYRPDHGSDAGSGLIFAGCDSPDYWDFLYFSTSIGASSQTSDTAVSSTGAAAAGNAPRGCRLLFQHCGFGADGEYRREPCRVIGKMDLMKIAGRKHPL